MFEITARVCLAARTTQWHLWQYSARYDLAPRVSIYGILVSHSPRVFLIVELPARHVLSA